MTVREVIKSVAPNLKSACAHIECKGITLWLDIMGEDVKNGKMFIPVSKGYDDFAEAVLNLEVDSYEFNPSNHYALSIKTVPFAVKHAV